MSTSTYCQVILTVSILCGVVIADKVEFNRSNTGVKFFPFVMKPNANGRHPPGSLVTFDDIKTMLKIVLSKFSRVITHTSVSKPLAYTKNHTYYKEADITARTGEAAALINQENKNKSLSVYLGVDHRDLLLEGKLKTDVLVGLEGAKIANKIFPGTVKGLVIYSQWFDESVDWAKTAFYWVNVLANMTVGTGLRIGARIPCIEFNRKDQSAAIFNLRKELLLKVDFFICDVNIYYREENFTHRFSDLTDEVLGHVADIRNINDKVEIMLLTRIPSEGVDDWQSVENLREHWIEADKFGSKHYIKIWLEEAFDVPRKSTYKGVGQSFGWWKLRDNSLIRDASGYIEKITGKSAGDFKGSEGLEENQFGMTSIMAGTFIGVIVLMSIPVTVFCVIYTKLKRKLRNILTKEEINNFKLGVTKTTTKENLDDDVPLGLPYNRALEISKNMLEIEEGKIIGSGEFGCVYKGRIKTDHGTEVAVKIPNKDCPKIALLSLLSEIKILSYLGEHPNIVHMFGAYTAEMKAGIVYLVTEFCSIGSLKNYLRNCYSKQQQEQLNMITYMDMVNWCHEIASGMEFIGQKNVIHADLATRNVLLSHAKTAKISDFGLSRRLYNYSKYVKKKEEPLPWRWMAIESMRKLEFSAQSDVWSYGVTIWEIFTMGEMPYPGISWTTDFIENLENGMRMKQPTYANKQMYELMLECWQLDPKNRPTFSKLKSMTKIYEHFV